jgi:hypothetical protein
MFMISCAKDPMGLNNPINRRLDSSIAVRISQIKADPSGTKEFDVFKVDQDIKGFWTTINLYNACTQTSENADKYFEDWALKLHLDKNAFISATALDTKPQIIVAIKTNELRLLNAIFQTKATKAGE